MTRNALQPPPPAGEVARRSPQGEGVAGEGQASAKLSFPLPNPPQQAGEGERRDCRTRTESSTQSPNLIASFVGRTPRILARALVKVYRYTLSALVGRECRHLPTCSDYADEALDRFGLWAGGWMTLARILRCNPWGTSGLDVVPESLPARTRWYMPWRYARWRGTNVGRTTG